MTEQIMPEEQILPTINHEDYVLWMDQAVTKQLFKHFKDVLEMTKESRLSRSLIESSKGLYKANYLLGYSEALEDVINFSIEDEE
jgi:hypothetical protein